MMHGSVPKWPICYHVNMAYSREERRQYQQAYRAKQRQVYIDLLGGVCSQCDETDGLEFDHVDRNTKKFTISGFNRSKAEILQELEKCQLLCKSHHGEKTRLEESQHKTGKRLTPQTHGTLTEYMKYKCRCEECRAQYSEYKRRKRAEERWS